MPRWPTHPRLLRPRPFVLQHVPRSRPKSQAVGTAVCPELREGGVPTRPHVVFASPKGSHDWRPPESLSSLNPFMRSLDAHSSQRQGADLSDPGPHSARDATSGPGPGGSVAGKQLVDTPRRACPWVCDAVSTGSPGAGGGGCVPLPPLPHNRGKCGGALSQPSPHGETPGVVLAAEGLCPASRFLTGVW